MHTKYLQSSGFCLQCDYVGSGRNQGKKFKSEKNNFWEL